MGQLAQWQSESVAPSAWSGFSVIEAYGYEYDELSRKTKEVVIGDDGATYRVTQFSYDEYGRLDCVAVRMNPAAFSALPASACNLGTAGVYGPDRITRHTYDGLNRLVQLQRGYGTAHQQDYATYVYSGNGLRRYVTDANGNVSEIVYDGHDRPKYLKFPSKTTPGQVNEADYEQYGYDSNGNRTSLRRRDGQVIGYAYDALNRLETKDLPSPQADVYFGYDLRSLQTYARFGSPTGQGVTTSYDGFGRLSTHRVSMNSLDKALGYQYDENGNRKRITYPDGNFFVYTYDGLDRLVDIKENDAAVLIHKTYNARGRVASINRETGAAVTGFDYDAVSRLRGVTHDFQGTAWDYNQVITRNPAGQVYTRSITPSVFQQAVESTATRSYDVNGLNQYTQIVSAPSVVPSWDANGNLTFDGSSNFTYDAENRLLSASGVKAATLSYDPLGRLHQIAGASGTTRLLYDGDALVAEFDGSGALLRRYVHGSDVDEPLIAYEGATLAADARRNLHTDHLGSIVAHSNRAGAPTQVDVYDSYGSPGVANGGRFQFTGQIYIPELAAYHYKARVYDPALGRFMQTDPVGSRDDVNLYAYVGNDPLNRADPTGLRGCTVDNKKNVPCEIEIVYNKKTSEGTLTVTATLGKERKVILQGNVVVGGDGHVTPTGKFTASYWEKDHVSTKYGWMADTPWSKSPLGINAFGPYQLHIKELEKRGIWIHGTMGPGWSRTTKVSGMVMSETSHGCVRTCNADVLRLHEIMPTPAGNQITISAHDGESDDDEE